MEIVNSDNYWTYEAAAYYLPQKRAPFFAFFYKTRANTQQVLPVQLVCTGTMNEWCKILTMKTLTEVKDGESSSQFRWFTIAKIEL